MRSGRRQAGTSSMGFTPRAPGCPSGSGRHQGATRARSGFRMWPEDAGGREWWGLLQRSHLRRRLGAEAGGWGGYMRQLPGPSGAGGNAITMAEKSNNRSVGTCRDPGGMEARWQLKRADGLEVWPGVESWPLGRHVAGRSSSLPLTLKLLDKSHTWANFHQTDVPTQ